MSLFTAVSKPGKDELYDLYFNQKLNCTQIAKLWNVGGSTIRRSMKEYNFNCRDVSKRHQTYSINDDFFETIDTEAKAYFLGLIYADGNNYPKRTSLKISLQERDCYILEILKKHLNYNGPLLSRPFSKKYPTHQDQWCLSINNKKISSDLLKHGVLPNKTLTLKFPTTVPDNLMNFFVLGFFDGDGSISSFKNSKGTNVSYKYTIIGTISMLDGFQKIFMEQLGLNKTKYDRHFATVNAEVGKTIKTICYGGNSQVKILGEYMYNNATIYLKRKKDRFDSIIIHKKSSNTNLKDFKIVNTY